MIWDTLPVEIQMHILHALVLHENSARYASVCRVWQIVIEEKVFAHLKVTRSRFAGFGNIGYHHRHLVKSIWLSIEAPENLCPECGEIGIPNWRQVSSKTIRKMIQDLVTHLSKWEPNGSLSLDISVKAPSALRDSSSIIQYGPGFIAEAKTANVNLCSHWQHDPNSWVSTSILLNRQTIIREPECKPRHGVPKARAVTSLLLRRQNRRPWKSEGLEELLHFLSEVREIYYEPWKDWRRLEQQPTNTTTMRLCEALTSHEMSRIVIFEDFHGYNPAMSIAVQAAEISIGHAIVEASLGLEHLAASFVTDGSHFFNAYQTVNIWPRLESLALTLNALNPQHRTDSINRIFERIVPAILKMPQLKLMELWNAGAGFAGVFRYQISENDRSAQITWRGTWDVPLEPRVVEAWQAVASKQAGCKFYAVTEVLDSEVLITSHGDAIRHLRLLNTVIHPFSFWQMQKETSR